MGLDLAVCPIRHYELDWWLTTERLSFDRDYDLFSYIANCGRGSNQCICNPFPLPERKRFEYYTDEGIKGMTKDDYGAPLTYVLAGEFRDIPLSFYFSIWNKAVLIFLKALPIEIPVVLWWH